MTASEARKAFADTYATIIDRNIYDQNKRSYVYTPSGGKYYSDCSSSICATFNRIGFSTSLLNTAGMHNSNIFEKVNVTITNGHIPKSEFSKLRQGDCIMYIGNDSSRPLQIGHVEAIYSLGTDENSTRLCGHGSGTPSYKNMATYNTTRYNSVAPNGKRKCAIEVLRRIPDDGSEGTNTDPNSPTGEKPIDAYVEGWNSDDNGWWFADSKNTYIKDDWLLKNARWYHFNESGYLHKGEQIIDGKRYLFVSEVGDPYEGAMYVSDENGALTVGLFDGEVNA